jgi:hypothetical protein
LNNENKNFIKLNADKGFTQLISKLTLCTQSSESLIDHIFCNNEQNVSDSGVLSLSLE